MEFVLFACSFLCLTLLYVVLRLAALRRAIYLPDALVLATASHSVGAMLLWYQNETDATLFVSYAAFLSYGAVIVCTVTALILSRPYKPLPVLKYFHSSRSYRWALLLATLANLGIVAILFSNPAIAALIIASFTATGDTTLLAARKAITASSEGYMSPGLIKLVRDLIGPIVIVSFILSRPRAYRSIMLWFAVVSSLLAMLIGGQRFPMVMIIVALAMGFFIRQTVEGRKIKLGPKVVGSYAIIILVAFYTMSSLLGRGSEGSFGLESFLWSFTSIFERIFSTIPNEAVKTFPLWSTIGPTGGLSWLSDLSIQLPGAAGATLSNELHQLGGGSAEGNAPLFLAADAWLAFGWIGIPFASLLFVTILHFIDKILWLHRSPRNDAARIVLYLNVPLMYSPFLFLLYGGLVVMPIVAWTLMTRRRRKTNASNSGRIQH